MKLAASLMLVGCIAVSFGLSTRGQDDSTVKKDDAAVKRAKRPETTIHDGDRLEVVAPLQGG